MSKFYNTSWLSQDRLHHASPAKRISYFFTRPFLSAYNQKLLSPSTIADLEPNLVLLGRGMPLADRRRWGASRCDLREAVILVQGTGTGWDVISWARLKPRKIIATDLFEFRESWTDIATYCHETFGVEVEFHQAPLEEHSFLESSSIDLCVSDAVFEHCTDLKTVLKESFRLLKPLGSLYASYGPLWFAPGGDHFSGRGGLKNVFNHLLLELEAYKKYFQLFLKPQEDFQSGGRYVELDLFSRLTTNEYLAHFKDAGFHIDELILEINPTGLAFKEKFPEIFNQLERKYTDRCISDDFLISANLIRLMKLG